MRNSNFAEKFESEADGRAADEGAAASGAPFARTLDASEVEGATNSLRLTTKMDLKDSDGPLVSDPLDQIIQKKTKRQHIREFAALIGLVFLIVASYKLFSPLLWDAFDSIRGREQSVARPPGNLKTILILSFIGALFALVGAWAPRLMSPVFDAWMAFARVLEKVMTFVILGAMWSVTFFPIGVIFKLIGKDPVNLTFDRSQPSYWESCETDRNDFALLERQY